MKDHNFKYAHVGEYIRDIRGERGLSQMELADRVGVHINTINNIERGLSNPRMPLVLKICIVLGVATINIDMFSI